MLRGVDWLFLAQDTVRWRPIVSTAVNLGVLKVVELLDQVSLSRGLCSMALGKTCFAVWE
jgi:hypothetical protein